MTDCKQDPANFSRGSQSEAPTHVPMTTPLTVPPTPARPASHKEIDCRIYSITSELQEHQLQNKEPIDSEILSYFFWNFSKKHFVSSEKCLNVAVNGSAKYLNLVAVCLKEASLAHKCDHLSRGFIQLDAWNPLPIEALSKDPALQVAQVLANVTNVTLYIFIFEMPSGVKEWNGVKNKLLEFYLRHNSTLLSEHHCPLSPELIANCLHTSSIDQDQFELFSSWHHSVQTRKTILNVNSKNHSEVSLADNVKQTNGQIEKMRSNTIDFDDNLSKLKVNYQQNNLHMNDSHANRELFYKKIQKMGFCERITKTSLPSILHEDCNPGMPNLQAEHKRVPLNTIVKVNDLKTNDASGTRLDSFNKQPADFENTKNNALANECLKLSYNTSGNVFNTHVKQSVLSEENMLSNKDLVNSVHYTHCVNSQRQFENGSVLNDKNSVAGTTSEHKISNSSILCDSAFNSTINKSFKEGNINNSHFSKKNTELKRPTTDPPFTLDSKFLNSAFLNQVSRHRDAISCYDSKSFIFSQSLQTPSQSNVIDSNGESTSPFVEWNCAKRCMPEPNDLGKHDRKILKADGDNKDRIWSPVFESRMPLNYNLYFDGTMATRWSKSNYSVPSYRNSNSNDKTDKKTDNRTENRMESGMDDRTKENMQEDRKYEQYEVEERQRRQHAMHTFHAAMSQAFNLHCLRHPASFFYPPQSHFSHTSSNFDSAKMFAMAAAVVGTDAEKSNNNANSPSESQDGTCSSDGDRRKRSRVFIDPLTEIPRLERWFNDDTHPSAFMIEQYTEELNRLPYRQRFPSLEPKNVQLWFKNHRAKVKRQKLEINCSNIPSSLPLQPLNDRSDANTRTINNMYTTVERSLENGGINMVLKKRESNYGSMEGRVLCYKNQDSSET